MKETRKKNTNYTERENNEKKGNKCTNQNNK